MDELTRLYAARFPAAARARRDALWRVLCEAFLQRYVRPGDTVLDLACGLGEFSRHIRAARRIAVDVNPDARVHLPREVEFHAGGASDMADIATASVDVCFSSNFFEHLPSKAALDAVLVEARRVLKPAGLYVAIQPNLRYAPGEYWDYYDHVLPLTDRSCAEAFAKAGYEIVEHVPRFLPFSTATRLPQRPWLLRAYLACPPAWRLFGRQFLLVARKPA
jgi:ubiquinone/menaquinone biosynthesis C-methylase UbiE